VNGDGTIFSSSKTRLARGRPRAASSFCGRYAGSRPLNYPRLAESPPRIGTTVTGCILHGCVPLTWPRQHRGLSFLASCERLPRAEGCGGWTTVTTQVATLPRNTSPCQAVRGPLALFDAAAEPPHRCEHAQALHTCCCLLFLGALPSNPACPKPLQGAK
jgi:hypothetical protein